ncbi:hypothetical protein VTI28DRAFT_4011 [Corynascus sepedonium]
MASAARSFTTDHQWLPWTAWLGPPYVQTITDSDLGIVADRPSRSWDSGGIGHPPSSIRGLRDGATVPYARLSRNWKAVEPCSLPQ